MQTFMLKHAQAWGIPHHVSMGHPSPCVHGASLTLLSQMSHGHVPALSPSALAFLPVAALSGLPSVTPTFAQLIGVSSVRHVHMTTESQVTTERAHISQKVIVNLSSNLVHDNLHPRLSLYVVMHS